MKLSGKIFSGCLLLAYITVSLSTLTNCAEKNNFSTSDQLNSSKKEIANLLRFEYAAEDFDMASNNIYSCPVLLDSTLIGVSQKEGNYFLRAKVNFKSSIKYFAELKCSKEIADLYKRTKSNSAYITAKITRIDNLSLVADADSLDGKLHQINLGKSILLTGECLALAEIPASINAD
ncbi:MAG: hypothetical protein NTX65_10740 [Ignavibacteriales bacterium]|nr:hypothetical protein [Ignavibacteriales bacterium]